MNERPPGKYFRPFAAILRPLFLIKKGSFSLLCVSLKGFRSWNGRSRIQSDGRECDTKKERHREREREHFSPYKIEKTEQDKGKL